MNGEGFGGFKEGKCVDVEYFLGVSFLVDFLNVVFSFFFIIVYVGEKYYFYL